MKVRTQLNSHMPASLTAWLVPPVRELARYVAVFALVYGTLSYGLVFLGRSVGLATPVLELIGAENEILWQVLALLAAGYDYDRLHGRNFWRQLLPWPKGGPELAVDLILIRFSQGFILGSLGVAMSVFAGFSRLQWPHWDIKALWIFGPSLIWQSFRLAAWIVVMESTRSRLWNIVARPYPKAIKGRLVIITFDAFLLYQVFCGTPHPTERAFLGIVCATLAAGLLLWLEASEMDRVRNDSWSGPLSRIFLQLGFWVVVLQIFGASLAGLKESSLIDMWAGPLREPTGTLATQGAMGQIIFILLLVWLNNTLLQRLLRRLSPAGQGVQKIDTQNAFKSLVKSLVSR